MTILDWERISKYRDLEIDDLKAKLKIAVEALKSVAKLRCDCGHELDAVAALEELEAAQKSGALKQIETAISAGVKDE